LRIIRPCLSDNTTEINSDNWLENRFKLRHAFLWGDIEPFNACIHKLSRETIKSMIQKVGETRFEVFCYIGDGISEKKAEKLISGHEKVIDYLESQLYETPQEKKNEFLDHLGNMSQTEFDHWFKEILINIEWYVQNITGTDGTGEQKKQKLFDCVNHMTLDEFTEFMDKTGEFVSELFSNVASHLK
jgi:hypothetical protein